MANETEEVVYVDEDQLDSLKSQGSNVLSGNNFPSVNNTHVGKDSVLGIYELDFHPFLLQIELDLRGLRFDKGKGQYVRDRNVKPLLPDECTRRLVNFLKSILSLNTPMTNLDEDRIKMSLNGLQKALDRMLFDFGYYEGVDVNVLWYLSRACGQQIENAMYRSKDGLERELRASNINVNAINNPLDNNEKDKKAFGIPQFWLPKKNKT